VVSGRSLPFPTWVDAIASRCSIPRQLTANVGISYIRNKVTARLQLNHSGRYLAAFSLNQSRLRYFRARSVVDLRTIYQISRHFDAYFDVTNIFGEADRAQEFYGGRPQTIHKMGPMFYVGLNARL
jgi:hypothetical protein